ncbi:ATP-dependent RNA helicase HrpA [Verminephrobacter eiseniae]|uniref:ATP-dependent helicase HrpA n=1 Tax=Verminephrobacter eiseniae (strain EF01-2) TaxID=391735 RepID=A1WG99_VEREI|nr:ATP-dependent RNA helicase HrpA [Verminephrobacter eiseniae]ABM56656.1 ATP-dependent helicase HrpA [Verminephrobacter eiseniae EF01-2]MCW5287014.1 ATP-dependent RNA helicase HrpA [Verminephrobacter eiseniae]MCW5305312.1 ATP-dependent RNA helicase HrpA [Verminephrobacter eiseniae]MCW8179699.1 ATP-dependent RNA helicase HrpA [Verminephrobacter eiseniae]MCW8189741.1 ATP-dependent RNA helicase HrpA [Verminephrobacter eiseniae]
MPSPDLRSPPLSRTPLHIEFPPALPVSGQREEIMAALARHQVVIVCGATGSGKTTQLPKIALALGRGRCNAKPGADGQVRGQLIGHTQPRRLAASSVAKRIAEELQTPLGEVVGFKVRFQDRLARTASVKLMTDGILLAETQTDPLLRAYDTIIIDEAHERSLNIDFLLGYLRQILPRRPDLKLVITSATIDADRFARHFASGDAMTCAPVIEVSGRSFPVELRWRPFEETREYGLHEAIADAVDELWQGAPGGDILVFLPGEREIREAADHLCKHLAQQPVLRNTEVLPLYARLAQAEQERIFDGHTGRRIVLATNVAETSLTVPGIRHVIDTGTARVKRYSFRSKVEQLLVEPISQAAANQRAGRCGRVADGICIRLYDEADFNSRPRFTDPEILRSSLAGVILRMKALHLGDVAQFPFLDAPSGRALADGYQLLSELGAVDDANQLTPMGVELARLPLDPRVGRMLVEARERQALAEVLVIASALSVQDVRDRPIEAQQQADQAQAKFDDDKSEFSGYLKLWKWLGEARGGAPGLPSARAQKARALGKAPAQAILPVAQRLTTPAAAPTALPASAPAPAALPTHKLSNRQYEQLLRHNFISPRRLREWRDIHGQLLTVVTEHQWPINTQPASYEQLHLSMLAGLLGNIGAKSDEQDWYLGARGIRFYKHPGAHLSKKPGRWVVAAELVETTRLFGRGMAAIEPQWLEQVGRHLLKKQLLDPHWEKKSADVVALERATLYGIVVYSGRRVNFGTLDPQAAREIFIREALVAGNWETRLPFLAANQQLIAKVQELEHKSRRQDVLVDDELIYAFYERQLPAEVCSGHSLETWYRQQSRQQPDLLRLTREELMRHEAAGITGNAFPRIVRLGGVDCAASYLHEPGAASDGITVTVPLFALNQVSEQRCEWLVPGMLRDKLQALLKSLPQRPRSRLVPLPETATRLAGLLGAPEHFGAGGLIEALLGQVRAHTSLDVQRADFKLDMLSPHLFMNFRLVDEHGRQLGHGRNLAALKAEWGGMARGAFQVLAGLKLGQAAGPPVESKPAVVREKHVSHVSMAAKSVAKTTPIPPAGQRYTGWTFGALPELLEISQNGQTLIGFAALIDGGDAVTIEAFDEPQVAAAQHRAGLRRLFALQIKDAVKSLEKNIPGLHAMAVAYMHVGRLPDGTGAGTPEELRKQIIDLALERAFMPDPLPADEDAFRRRVDEGRERLALIANEVARLAATILAEYAAAARKIRDTRNAPEATQDAQQQLQRLMPKNFIAATPWTQLLHYARYLKAITLRLDKIRTDPARDAARLAELRPQEQRYWRLVAERKGAIDARMQELRWLLEELRVSFFAQELRTPQPVSVKRLDKLWAQIKS